MLEKSLRIGLLWHTYGHGNLGIDALSRANIAIIRAAAERACVKPQFVLLGTPGHYSPNETDVEVGPRLRLKRLARGDLSFFKAVNSCDLVFDTSEGDSFSDIYGNYRFLLQSATKWTVLLCGKLLVLSPQTIGPFRRWWTRTIAAYLLKRTYVTFTRDALSSDALTALGVVHRTFEAIDVAFRLPFQPQKGRGDGVVRIGVNVSGLLFYKGSRFGLTIDYQDLIRRFLAIVSVRPNTEVWLIPHVVVEGATDDDLAVSKGLQAEFPALRTAPRFHSSIEAKTFIAGLNMFTGGRMHACLAAFSAGVPVVPVAYSRKFTGLFNTVGYDRVIDGRTASTKQALDVLLRTIDEREVAAVEVAACLPEADRRLVLYETEVVKVLEIVAGQLG